MGSRHGEGESDDWGCVDQLACLLPSGYGAEPRWCNCVALPRAAIRDSDAGPIGPHIPYVATHSAMARVACGARQAAVSPGRRSLCSEPNIQEATTVRPWDSRR